jgi:hypothetical protein
LAGLALGTASVSACRAPNAEDAGRDAATVIRRVGLWAVGAQLSRLSSFLIFLSYLCQARGRILSAHLGGRGHCAAAAATAHGGHRAV